MSKQKHTDGWEWEAVNEACCASACTPSGCAENHFSGYYQVFIPGQDCNVETHVETKEHARLIAAAPDLLEALKIGVTKDGCACDIESVDGHHLYVCYKHQAIAKAEGA